LATLLTLVLFSLSSLYQIDGLRQLQTDISERNRRDSLQLIRIQNDLNLLGHAMRDMIEDRDGYGVEAWRGEFTRIREDLSDAIAIDQGLTTRPAEHNRHLAGAVEQFWRSADEVFDVAAQGETTRAQRMITDSLQAQQASLATTVARLLVQNNEAEEQAAREIASIYDRVERHLYLFVIAMLAGTTAIGLTVAHYNRRLFNQLNSLSQQRSTLARGLISVQEEVFRSVSRELHDDFGQILTAIGVMLQRAEKRGLPADSPLRADVAEIRQVAQEALEKTRSFSQALHPTILDDYGLERAIERHSQSFEKQTGIATVFDRDGSFPVAEARAIHMYRVVQEALTNVARHSQATKATVRLHRRGNSIVLQVEDDGKGMPEKPVSGLGLIAMRERAELLRGTFDVKRNGNCGTLVSLEVPLE
jgi:signal transduction histidine kinase